LKKNNIISILLLTLVIVVATNNNIKGQFVKGGYQIYINSKVDQINFDHIQKVNLKGIENYKEKIGLGLKNSYDVTSYKEGRFLITFKQYYLIDKKFITFSATCDNKKIYEYGIFYDKTEYKNCEFSKFSAILSKLITHSNQTQINFW